MATILKKASVNEQNVVDLVFEIKKQKQKVESKASIDSRKRNIEDLKRQNKKFSSRVSYLKKKIEKSSPTDMSMLPYYEELDRLQRKGKATHKDRYGNEVTLVKYDIRWMNNDLKKAQGKDYYYRIKDGFNKPYNVKRSDIMKMEDSSFFVNKFEKGIKQKIKELKSNPNLDKAQKKKLYILEEKLLKTVGFNKKLIKFGNVDEKDLPSDFRTQVDKAFDKGFKKEDKEGEYPINIIILDDLVEF